MFVFTLFMGFSFAKQTKNVNESSDSLSWSSSDSLRRFSLLKEIVESKKTVHIKYVMEEPFPSFDTVALHVDQHVYIWNLSEVGRKKIRYVPSTPRVEHRVWMGSPLGIKPDNLQRPISMGGSVRVQGHYQRNMVRDLVQEKTLTIQLILVNKVIKSLSQATLAELRFFDSQTGETMESFILDESQLTEAQSFLINK